MGISVAVFRDSEQIFHHGSTGIGAPIINISISNIAMIPIGAQADIEIMRYIVKLICQQIMIKIKVLSIFNLPIKNIKVVSVRSGPY